MFSDTILVLYEFSPFMENDCILGGRLTTLKIKKKVADVFPAGSVRKKE
jgi:hypothetical protein